MIGQESAPWAQDCIPKVIASKAAPARQSKLCACSLVLAAPAEAPTVLQFSKPLGPPCVGLNSSFPLPPGSFYSVLKATLPGWVSHCSSRMTCYKVGQGACAAQSRAQGLGASTCADPQPSGPQPCAHCIELVGPPPSGCECESLTPARGTLVVGVPEDPAYSDICTA